MAKPIYWVKAGWQLVWKTLKNLFSSLMASLILFNVMQLHSYSIDFNTGSMVYQCIIVEYNERKLMDVFYLRSLLNVVTNTEIFSDDIIETLWAPVIILLGISILEIFLWILNQSKKFQIFYVKYGN